MGKETICVIDRSDLVSMLSELYEGRFDGREVDRVSNAGEKRVERKFDLAYLFSLDVRQIKQQYRMLNK